MLRLVHKDLCISLPESTLKLFSVDMKNVESNTFILLAINCTSLSIFLEPPPNFMVTESSQSILLFDMGLDSCPSKT